MDHKLLRCPAGDDETTSGLVTELEMMTGAFDFIPLKSTFCFPVAELHPNVLCAGTPELCEIAGGTVVRGSRSWRKGGADGWMDSKGCVDEIGLELDAVSRHTDG